MISNFFLDNRIGGPHNYILNINKTISKKIKFQYITCGKSNLSNIYISNLRFHFIFLFPFEIIFNFFEIIFFVIKKKITNKIFFVHGIYNIAPILAGCILNKDVYWSIIETPNTTGKIIFSFLKFIFNFKIVLISKKIKKNLNLSDDFIYLPPFIDKNFWKRSKYPKKIDKIKILCVGNINKNKGHDKLIENLKKIKFKINVKIVGEKLKTQIKYYENLKERVLNYQKKNKNFRVKFEGFKSGKKLKKLYESSDVFILPSIKEGLPIVVLEAMSMECFCITSDCGNLSSIIKNKKNGFIFDHKKNDFMKKLLLFKSLNKTQKRQIQRSARKTIDKFFSNKILYKKFYENII